MEEGKQLGKLNELINLWCKIMQIESYDGLKEIVKSMKREFDEIPIVGGDEMATANGFIDWGNRWLGEEND